MPNQRAENKQSVTVSLPRDLVKEMDKIADTFRVSRTHVMTRILECKVAGKEIEHATKFFNPDAQI